MFSSSGNGSSSSAANPSFPPFPGFPSFLTPNSSTSHPHPHPQVPERSLSHSSDNSDLARLERLKKEILEGQNPIYKATPHPDYLESLYLGRSLQEKKTVNADVKAEPCSTPEVIIKQEEVESPLPGFQMSDIMALSSKLLKPDTFTVIHGPNGVEVRKKSEPNVHYTNHASSAPQDQRREAPQLPNNPGATSSNGHFSTDSGTDTSVQPFASKQKDDDRLSPITNDTAGASDSLANRIGNRVPLEERLTTPEHQAHHETSVSSLQNRIGERVTHQSTPILSPASLSTHPSFARPESTDLSSSIQKSYDFSEEVIRQAIHECDAAAAASGPTDRVKPSLDSRLEHDRSSLPPKFAAKRSGGEVYPPPIHRSSDDRVQGHNRRPSNASRASDEAHVHHSPSRADSYAPGGPQPLSWDRTTPRSPPAVYPPPSSNGYDTRSPYGGYRGRDRAASPHRRPSDDYRPPKRGRDEDFYDQYDRRFVDHRGPPPSSAGYYGSRGPYPSRSSEALDYGRRPPVDRGVYRPDAPYMPPPRTA